MFVLALTYASSGFAPLTSANERSRDSGSKSDPKKHDGKKIFRFDTFGDEQFWTDVLRMHEAISEVDPATALKVGLKVDVEALPRAIIAALRAGDVDLTKPAVDDRAAAAECGGGSQG